MQSFPCVNLIQEVLCGAPQPRKYTHAYSITPTNFLILPPERQRRCLDAFFEILRMLQSTAMITLERVPITVQYGGENHGMEAVRVMLDCTESLDETLEKLGFSYTIDDEPHPDVRITAESVRDFECAYGDDTHQNTNGGNKMMGRAYTIYGTPTYLPPAWIHQTFRTFHRMQMHITPVKPDDALKKMENRQLLYSGIKTRKADIQKKLRDITVLKQGLELGNSMAYTFVINGFVFAKDRKRLAELHSMVRRNTAAMNIKITSSLGRQRHLASGGGARWIGSLESLHILYPFASSDMLEVPNGVPLGRNRDTGAPVIYDINQRKNHNVFTAGTTGSGKSFTNKLLLKRFLEKRPNTMCIVVDPQGEYLPHAQYFGLEGMEIRPGQQYGLDPFALFDSALEAADLIGSATNAPNEVRREWRSICDDVRSVEQLYEKSSENARKYLADMVRGSISEVFRGVPKFGDKMIISLRNTDGQEYEGLLILLVLAYAWRRVNEIPAQRWKFVLLDEAWRMTKIRQSIKKIGEMARQGRKRSLIFAVSTQQFSDMDRALDDGSSSSSRLTELFDTKIIMQMSQSAARSTGAALDLTDREIEQITNFHAGSGLLHTGNNSVYLKFEATRKETAHYFNTKAEKDDTG